MDEADELGDRIAIMREGQLVTCGSSLFLKNRYGAGYNISIAKNNSMVSSAPIINFIKETIPSASVLSNISTEITLQLPKDDKTNFRKLFDGLDTQKNQLQIQSYGISITTLDDVFLKLADDGHFSKQNEFLHQKNSNDTTNESLFDEYDPNTQKETSPAKLFLMHIFALIMKRVHYFKRDKRGFICEIFLPCLIVLFGLLLMTINFVMNPSPLVLNASIYADSTPLYTLYAGTPP